jgi:hypothetical protein
MAAKSCLVQDMGGARIDMAGALAVASSYGVTPDVAAPLLSACGEGLLLGAAEKAEAANAEKAD